LSIDSSVRILVLGAHPDDAEFHAGAFLAKHANLGATIRIISVTDGRSGHQSIPSSELVEIRRKEAAAAGAVIGSEYVTWDFPDGSLTPSLEVRWAIIRELRTFNPELVLTHRTVDYHPDHRAVAQAVQDASYMVRVPKVVPDVPPVEREPIVAAMNDRFTRPCPLRADYVIDGTNEFEKMLDMMDCHQSQFYDWMPWIDRAAPPSSMVRTERLAWLKDWFLKFNNFRANAFWNTAWGKTPIHVEAFEISEYAGFLSAEQSQRLFPGAFSKASLSIKDI